MSNNRQQILAALVAATIDEAVAGIEAAHHGNFSGICIGSTQNGDHIIVGIWHTTIQANVTTRNDDFFYDRITVNTSDKATISNHASILDTSL